MACALPAYDGKEFMTAVRRLFLPVALAVTAVFLLSTACAGDGSSPISASAHLAPDGGKVEVADVGLPGDFGL
jgi:hypothetical protein